MKKIIIAVTGASGSIYAKQLIDSLTVYKSQIEQVGIVFSENAKDIWNHEISTFSNFSTEFNIYDNKDFNAPFASGSAKWDSMVICPCSVGILGRISNGISSDLITRAADVMLKERKRIVAVVRETPYNLIHIENMKQFILAGGIVCPATPSFYTKPTSIENLVQTVIDRVLDLIQIEIESPRWGKL